MRHYPIWNTVKSCLYKKPIAWGGKDHSKIEINVGSSASNSHELAKIETNRRVFDEEIVFSLSVDGKTVKRLVFKNNNGKAGELLRTKIVL